MKCGHLKTFPNPNTRWNLNFWLRVLQKKSNTCFYLNFKVWVLINFCNTCNPSLRFKDCILEPWPHRNLGKAGFAPPPKKKRLWFSQPLQTILTFFLFFSFLYSVLHFFLYPPTLPQALASSFSKQSISDQSFLAQRFYPKHLLFLRGPYFDLSILLQRHHPQLLSAAAPI